MNTDLPKYTGAHWRPFDVLKALGFSDKEVMRMAGEGIGMLRRWRDPKVGYRHLTPTHVKRLRKAAALILSRAWSRQALVYAFARSHDQESAPAEAAVVLELNRLSQLLLGMDVPIWKIDEWLEALALAEAAEEAQPDELCD